MEHENAQCLELQDFSRDMQKFHQVHEQITEEDDQNEW